MTKPVVFEYDPCKQPVFWYVVFQQRRTNLMPWWVRMWLGLYGHCFAFRDYAGVTLTVNHLAQGLIVDASPLPAVKCVEVLAAEDADTVVLFAGRLKYRYTQRGVQSCVSVVKSLVGLAAWHIWTPDQLYRHLIQHGGVVLWEGKAARSFNRAKPSVSLSMRANAKNSRSASS